VCAYFAVKLTFLFTQKYEKSVKLFLEYYIKWDILVVKICGRAWLFLKILLFLKKKKKKYVGVLVSIYLFIIRLIIKIMSKRLNILPVLMLFFVFLSNISVAIDLTENEKHWLKNHPVIRIGPDPEFPPIEYFNDKGKYIGIAADYMSIIENQLGIKFEVIRYDTWDEVIKAAKDRKIDFN